MNKRGISILLEGPDAIGKSSVIKELVKLIPNTKHFFDPGISHDPKYERWQMLRNFIKTESMSPDTELLLFFAMRSELMSEMSKELNNGYNTIQDRGHISSFIYQGILKGQSELITRLEQSIKFPQPDLTFVLSAPFEVVNDRLMARLKTQNANMDKFKASKDFRFKVWSEYENYIKKNEGVIRIDANQTISEIVEEIKGDILIKLNIETHH